MNVINSYRWTIKRKQSWKCVRQNDWFIFMSKGYDLDISQSNLNPQIISLLFELRGVPFCDIANWSYCRSLEFHSQPSSVQTLETGRKLPLCWLKWACQIQSPIHLFERQERGMENEKKKKKIIFGIEEWIWQRLSLSVYLSSEFRMQNRQSSRKEQRQERQMSSSVKLNLCLCLLIKQAKYNYLCVVKAKANLAL